jgi:hypothetical protein
MKQIKRKKLRSLILKQLNIKILKRERRRRRLSCGCWNWKKTSIEKDKKITDSTRVNLLNSWPVSWDREDHIEFFFLKYETQFPTNIMLKDKIEKIIIRKNSTKKDSSQPQLMC